MKHNNIKTKLRRDPDAYIGWIGGNALPTGGYDTEEFSGLRIKLLLTNSEDVLIITILPGDEKSAYDAYIRKLGSTEMLHLGTFQAKDFGDVLVAVFRHLPDYMTHI